MKGRQWEIKIKEDNQRDRKGWGKREERQEQRDKKEYDEMG